MLRISKKADYGLIALRHLAANPGTSYSCREIAERYNIPFPLMAKILQKLVRGGFVVSQQGINGGYVLARRPEQITAVEVIEAIEGPVSLTSCNTYRGPCVQFDQCTVKDPLELVNQKILKMLQETTIHELAGTIVPLQI
ncbi:MAG: SUF system Fe-S cluster assembly regulator [Acidobacteria bacterium]|nr:SUF system Fe-S cluster assembly regulator [Acidobacteriota bacterium]